jgi:hypothetical protein
MSETRKKHDPILSTKFRIWSDEHHTPICSLVQSMMVPVSIIRIYTQAIKFTIQELAHGFRFISVKAVDIEEISENAKQYLDSIRKNDPQEIVCIAIFCFEAIEASNAGNGNIHVPYNLGKYASIPDLGASAIKCHNRHQEWVNDINKGVV